MPWSVFLDELNYFNALNLIGLTAYVVASILSALIVPTEAISSGMVWAVVTFTVALLIFVPVFLMVSFLSSFLIRAKNAWRAVEFTDIVGNVPDSQQVDEHRLSGIEIVIGLLTNKMMDQTKKVKVNPRDESLRKDEKCLYDRVRKLGVFGNEIDDIYRLIHRLIEEEKEVNQPSRCDGWPLRELTEKEIARGRWLLGYTGHKPDHS